MLINDIRSFTTLAMVAAATTMVPCAKSSELKPTHPDLPKAITSFGAVKSGAYVYVYGGHSGKAHSYSVDTTLNTFYRLSIKSPTKWEALASDVRVQGTSLVTYDGSIYRIGGLTVLNKETAVIEDDNQNTNLRSMDDFARYHPRKNQWEQLPPMPEPRSSHDSVVIGHHLFVIGGWKLAGKTDEAQWFDTMFVTDLSAEKPSWETLPQPFRHRAAAVSTLDNDIYVIGGMDSEGDTSNQVHVYDPIARTWSRGPSLPNGPMKGFGAAACTIGNQLFVSHYAGDLFALSPDQKEWLKINELEPKRFFHRMVPASRKSVFAIGGANRNDGHLASIQEVSWNKR